MLILELVRPERVYIFSSVRNIRPDPSLWIIFTSVSNVCIRLTCERKRECNCQRLSLCPKLSLITWQQKKKKKILELDHSIQKSRIYLQKHPNNNSLEIPPISTAPPAFCPEVWLWPKSVFPFSIAPVINDTIHCTELEFFSKCSCMHCLYFIR